jgi:hypothetical protein
MRTLQEKYNAIQEGKFSKENFLADARRELPNLVTRFNGYDDAVQILKNRGMIQEARVEEARLTKNNLTDYRYKPTNEMDKYPYEQILRGLRVELEAMEVHGTPTAEEYAKALAKVSKNLAKDSIFYTNQLAGVNPKVDLHDKMVDVTAKNTVDTFNGMKKAELKEGFKKLIKRVLSEEVMDVESYKEEEEVYEMYGEDDMKESAMGDIYQIAQEHDRFEHFVQAVEDEFGPVEDIAELEHIFNNTRGEDDINYGDENFSDPMIDGELDEATDTEADKNMVRKLMTMYETEPSKFERVHKQAQVQADTTKDIKAKHLVSLFDRAKAGALQSLANQDRFEADREGMDENADKFYAPTYITQKYGAAKAKEIEANIEDEGANTWDLFTSLETPKEVDDFIGGFTMDESISLKDLL